MIKLCVWMDVPSHYQSAFYKALDERDDVDLQVCYTKEVSSRRAAQGWSSSHEYQPFEQCVAGLSRTEEKVAAIPGWEERTHVISSYISREIIDFFCANNVRWCHWSEPPGVRLAGVLGYRMGLYRLLNPLMLALKRRDASRIRQHAVAAFGQGLLAERAFRKMGIFRHKIADLFYAPEPLPELEPSPQVATFADGRKVLLSVGALCRRKGIDILLKAFAGSGMEDWVLVLCGLDKSDGAYAALARRLGIEDRVLFLGAYPAERIAEVYAVADLFVLASRFDGWGAVLNEAASIGLPLIGTDLCGASWHVIDEGKNGCRARADSVKSLQQALRYFVDDPDTLERFGPVSKALYQRELTPQRNAERLVEHLSRMGVAQDA